MTWGKQTKHLYRLLNSIQTRTKESKILIVQGDIQHGEIISYHSNEAWCDENVAGGLRIRHQIDRIWIRTKRKSRSESDRQEKPDPTLKKTISGLIQFQLIYFLSTFNDNYCSITFLDSLFFKEKLDFWGILGLYDQKKTQSGSKLFQKPDTYPSFQKPESDPIFQKPETDPIFTKPDTDPCFYKPDPDPQPCVARCWLRFNLFDKFGKFWWMICFQRLTTLLMSILYPNIFTLSNSINSVYQPWKFSDAKINIIGKKEMKENNV